MIALFIEPSAHGFFVRFATGRFQQLNGFVLEGLTQLAEAFQAKVGFLLLECHSGAQHGLHFAYEVPVLDAVRSRWRRIGV